METIVEINGRRATIVTEAQDAHHPSGSASSSVACNSDNTSITSRKRHTAGAFHCSLCDVYFWDSAAVAAHRASRRHRENTGELARERMKYKVDAEVTVDDIMDLVEKKRIEKGPLVVSLSDLLANVGGKRPRSGDGREEAIRLAP
jgi:hypothetical protein